MLSLLLDKDFWLLIGLVAIIGLLIWAWIKFNSARVIISTIAIVVVAGFTTYSEFYINSYYSAEGGIYGQITSLFDSSVDVEDLTFTFNDIQLLQYNDSDRYYAYLYTSDVISIDDDTEYAICVNGKECDSTVTSDFITAEFTMAFYNLAGTSIVAVDTLHINFSLNLKNTYTYVYTDSGSTCATYWSQYFKNNGFTVTIVESTSSSTIKYASEDTDTLAYYRSLVSALSAQVNELQAKLSAYESTDSPTIAELEEEIASLEEDIATLKTLLESYAGADEAVVYFYYNNTLYASPIVTIGTTLADIDVDDPEDTDYIVFNGWTVDGVAIDSTYTITGTTTIVADLTYYYDVIFYVDSEAYSTQLVESGCYATQPIEPTLEGYTFEGWSLDEETVISLSDNPITATTCFYAVFENNIDYAQYTNLLFMFDEEELTCAVGCSSTNISGDIVIPSHVSKDDITYTVTSFYSSNSGDSFGYGFYGCTKITSITIPETIETLSCIIGSGKSSQTFYNCKSLTNVYYLGSLEQWTQLFPSSLGSPEMNPMCYAENFYLNNELLTNIDLSSSSISRIYKYTFYGFSCVETISLPETLETIDTSAFAYCSSLKQVNLPKSLTVLGSSAFYYCSNLSTLTGEYQISSLYSNTFAYCSSLSSIWLPSTITYIIGEKDSDDDGSYIISPFVGCSSSLIIYCESSSKYSGWESYWNYYSTSAKLTVKYGYTYSAYLTAIS